MSHEGGSVQYTKKCGKTEHWGDRLKRKPEDTYRLVLNNVNSIGLYAGGMKDEQVRQFLEKWDVDIYGMTEPNVNWSKVRKQHNWWERTEKWFEARRLAVAFNTKRGRLATKSQYGGTITMCRNEISHRSPVTSYDESGLGRWSSIAFRGLKKSVTRVVTVYCACPNNTGPHTVYSQQLKVLDCDPIEKFYCDLGENIKRWQQQGEQLIIMGDWNTETQSKKFMEWYIKLGLIDPILEKHKEGSPGTYNKGNRRLDCILISATLKTGRCGWLPFDSMPGDHRVGYLDIKVKDFIGHRPGNIPSHAARRLKLDDPRVVRKYQEILDESLQAAGAFAAVKRLQTYVTSIGTFDDKAEALFESIDKKREEAMKIAERKCRKLKMGGLQWSPALQYGRDKILLWTLVLRRLLGRNIGAKRILRLKKRLKISNTLVTKAQATSFINQAFTEYKVLRKNDRQLSRTYRDELAIAKAEEGNLTVAGVIRGLDSIETQRKVARRIKQTLGKTGSKGTSKIEIKNPDGTIREITDPDEMTELIAEENREKFHQTYNCPLFQKQLLEDLGLLGDGPEVINVLNGTYQPPEGTSWATRRWLKHMKIQDPSACKEITTSLAEYRQGWKKANERTASGELHMGHFKASARHSRLGWMNFVMAVLPYTAGYVPRRWRKGTDVMLLKKDENFLLSKLRTIVLYEADFNHENKRLGRSAMKQAVAKGNIAKEQFSRPARSAQENVICKRLIFDYCRSKKKAFGMCACDLKSCYDQIVHVAASLALQRIGVSVGKIRSMFGAVQQLVHKIRTLYGDSDCFYGGEDDPVQHELPPQGSGQGNGAGPTIWSVLSSTIFEILHEEGFATQFIFSISKGLFELCGFSYVDDCDLFHIGDDVEDVHARMQEMLTMWDQLMEVNGAAIAPDKCWWYIADFKWTRGRCKMVDAGKGRTLQVRDKDQKMQSLTNLPLSEAKEMLGVFLAPDGNEKQALQSLVNKTTVWTNFIISGGLDWFSTWQALRTTIHKSICYSLPALTLTTKELEEISKPLHAVALPRSGYSRTFPKKVLYGPKSLQGLGLENLLTEQYVPKVKAIIDFMYKNATSGNIVKNNIEVVKLEAGIPGPLFSYEWDLTFLNGLKSWVAETKHFCWKNAILFAERGTHLKTKCEKDELIMDVFLKYGNYSVAELRLLNRCRMYLQVTTLSDITTGDGKFLADGALQGSESYQTDNYDWPYQQKPPRAEWNAWAGEVRRHFAPIKDRLSTPLGKWFITDEYYTSWAWWLDTNYNLYHFGNNQWHSINSSGPNPSNRVRSKLYQMGISIDTLLPQRPGNIFRTHVNPMINGIFDVGEYRSVITKEAPTTFPHISFIDHLRNSEDSWLFQHTHQYVDVPTIIQLLYNNDLVAVSDGSFQPRNRRGSLAWCIATKKGKLILEGGGLIPGKKDDQGSYRSEAGGLLGPITVAQILEKIQPPPQHYEMTIACDGESALYQSIQLDPEKVSSAIKHADLISRIQDRKKPLKGRFIPIHVKGHQDEKSSSLTILEQLNVKMDDLAKRIAEKCKHEHILNLPHLPESKDGLPNISVHRTPIVSEIEKTIKFGIATIDIKEWWIEKGRFTAADDPYIDWLAMEYCMSNCDSRYKRFIPKWVSRQIATGKVMRYRKARVHNRCPRCNAFTEDTNHVLRCQTRKTRDKWDTSINNLSEWLTKIQTSPEINISLCSTLRYWRSKKDSDHYVNPEWGDNIKRVFEHQALLGWNNMLEGILSTGWADLQQRHYDSISSRKQGQKWAGSLSIQLWKIVYGMWEHRNAALFKSEKISEFCGSKELRKACLEELEMGIGELDELYHPYLDTSSEYLFKENLDYQRNWFSIVRQARERKSHMYDDIFSTCNNTREWAGLEPLQCSVESNSEK